LSEQSKAGRFVVGLGNPERRYEKTRHNVGFMVLRELRRRWDLGRGRSKFHARVWSGPVAGRAATLAAPQTYMNRSGLAVGEIAGFHKAAAEDVLIVLDDLALPPGQIRLRAGGSAGGHNGLADVIAALGTDRVPRLRVGIGPTPERMDTKDYVLSRFDETEEPVMVEAIGRAADAVEDWIARGVTYAMDRHNRPDGGGRRQQEGHRKP
jgi:PTH1 family peptidyl-tRNA hydrolase